MFSDVEMPRRKLIDRVKAIFSMLEKLDNPVYKSDFKHIGISPTQIDEWLDIIQFIQSRPRIIIKKAGRYTTVELEEDSKIRE